MPSYNLTLDDTSPLWTYSGEWKDIDKSDKWRGFYSNGTFHATNQNGASARLTFNGTGVYLFGAKRDNHDVYGVILDGQGTMNNGFAPLPNDVPDFQQLLFGRGGLDPGEHTVELADLSDITNAPWLDLDFGIITLGDGNDSTISRDVILDDGSENITYSAGWDSSPNDWATTYWGLTMHRTNVTDAAATVNFYGHAATVFGAVSTNHGAYAVSLDGGPSQPFTGLASEFHAQQILYAVSNLEFGEHQLVITHTGRSWEYFDLDYVAVSSWGAKASENATSSGSTSSSGSGGSKISTGALAGGAVGGILGLAAVGALLYLILCRRRCRAQPEKYGHILHSPASTSHSGPCNPGQRAELEAAVPGDAPRRLSTSESHINRAHEHGSETRRMRDSASRWSRNLLSLREHIDLPPPGYDQVTRNRATAVAMPDPAAPTSAVQTSRQATFAGPATPLGAEGHTVGLGNPILPPEKGERVERQTSERRPLPTVPVPARSRYQHQ